MVVEIVSDRVLESLRAEMPATLTTVYLNAGSNGPIPNRVRQELEITLTREVEQGRIAPGQWEGQLADNKRLRGVFASIAGSDADEIALMRSTIEGLNVALMGIDWHPGDEVITTNLEHNGLYSPLGLLSVRQGVTVNTVDIGNGGGGVAEAIEQAISPRTRVVAISHLQWSTGAIMPLPEIVDICRSRGVLVVVDAAQSIGHIPVDVHALGVDAYAMSGQKWLCGPVGTGALYVRRESMADINPTYLRNGVFDTRGFVAPPEGAVRYEMGGQFNPVVRGLEAGLVWLRDEVGFDWMFERHRELGARCRRGLAGIAGIEVVTPESNMAGLVCFTVDGMHPKDVSGRLYERGFTIRHVEQFPCPVTARVSVAWWNTEQEIDDFIDATADIVRHPRR